MIKHYRLVLDLKVEIGEQVRAASAKERDNIEALLKLFLDNDEAVREFFRMKIMEELNQGDLVAGWDNANTTSEVSFWKTALNGCDPRMERQFLEVIEHNLESLYEQIGEFELTGMSFDQIQFGPNLFDILRSEKTEDSGEGQFPQVSILINAALFDIQHAYIIKLKTGFHLLVRHFDVILFSRTFPTEKTARDSFSERFSRRLKEKYKDEKPDWSFFFDYGAGIRQLDSVFKQTEGLTIEDIKSNISASKHLVASEL